MATVKTRIWLSIVVTAVLCLGAGVAATWFIYNMEHKTRVNEIDENNNLVTKLRLEVADMKAAEVDRAKTASPTPSATPTPSPIPAPAPTVSYVGFPAGSATNTLKVDFKKFLVDPFTDFRAEYDQIVVTIGLKYPAKTGLPYGVTVTYKAGDPELFEFGKRGTALTYWKPTCNGGCQFSDAFKTKYPDVVK